VWVDINPLVCAKARGMNMNNRRKEQRDAGQMTRAERRPKRSGLGEYGQVALAGIAVCARIALWDLTQMMLERWARRR